MAPGQQAGEKTARGAPDPKGGYRVPTLVLADGAVLTEPGNAGVGGAELADRLATQAGRFGAGALQGQQTTDICRDGWYLVVKTANKSPSSGCTKEARLETGSGGNQ